MNCKICKINLGHYCSSCDPVVHFDFGLCWDCWVGFGLEDLHEAKLKAEWKLEEDFEKAVYEEIKKQANKLAEELTQ